MAMTQHWTVIGIFDDQMKARQAILSLENAGFTHKQIGFVTRDTRKSAEEGVPVSEAEQESGEGTGVVTGHHRWRSGCCQCGSDAYYGAVRTQVLFLSLVFLWQSRWSIAFGTKEMFQGWKSQGLHHLKRGRLRWKHQLGLPFRDKMLCNQLGHIRSVSL